MPDYVPSTPDPEMTVLVAAFIRHVLTFLSGVGLVHGVYSDSMVQVLAGAIVAAAAAGWAIWQKYQIARKDHEGSVRSAEAAVSASAMGTTLPPAASAVRAA